MPAKKARRRSDLDIFIVQDPEISDVVTYVMARTAHKAVRFVMPQLEARRATKSEILKILHSGVPILKSEPGEVRLPEKPAKENQLDLVSELGKAKTNGSAMTDPVVPAAISATQLAAHDDVPEF